MSLTAAQIFELNHMNSTAFKHSLGTLISNASDIIASEIALVEGSILLGNSSAVGAALDGSGDTKILIGNATTMASFALSGDVSMTNGGLVTVVDLAAVTGHLSVQETTPAGASPGHIIKGTAISAGTFSGSHAGLIVKQYDAANDVVHNGGELCGLYVNLKQLSAMQAGGESALISAHNYGSGGDYQVVDYGLRLFGNLDVGIELTGGTSNFGLDFSDQTISTSDFKLSNGGYISNVVNNQIENICSVFKHSIDVAAYWTATVADGGAVTFASVSDGTAGFTFSQPILGTLDLNAKFDCQATIAAGASPGHIIKGTLAASGTYTGTNSGLIIKSYDADNSVVHNESELCGLYVNLKQLSAMLVGGKSALISAHNYGSGGDYQVVDFGLRLFGNLVDGVEITGGTVTSAIKLDTCTALTNVLKLADSVGCTVGSDGMTKDPEGGAEDGFITIDISGTSYQIPVYTA